MSRSQEFGKVTASSDGITVVKRFEADEFPVPAIAFEIQSDRSEPVAVRLVDVVPDAVAVGDLGFHPEYGSEYWSIEEDRISFERVIDPEGSYTTVYGIRATGTDDVEQFLEEPTVETIEQSDEDRQEPEGADTDRGQMDSGPSGAAGDSGGEPDNDTNRGEDVDVGTLDLTDPNAPGEGGSDGVRLDEPGNGSASADVTDVGITGPNPQEQSLVAMLATEIRTGNVSGGDLAVLRDALDADESGTTEARIERLQTDVADLLAYTDALEEFLDENGTGEQLLGEFRERVESVESDLDDLRSRSDERAETLSTLEGDLSAVRSSMEALESDVEELGADLEGVVDEVESTHQEVTTLSGTVDELEERVEDENGSDLEAELADLREEIEEIKEWRETLSSVMSGE